MHIIWKVMFSPNSDFSDCLDATANFALPSVPLFTPIKNRLLPDIKTKAFYRRVASSLWHHNCFFPLDRMQVLSIFSVCRPDATKPAFGLKKEALPKLSRQKVSKPWLHPINPGGILGMNPCLLKPIFNDWSMLWWFTRLPSPFFWGLKKPPPCNMHKAKIIWSIRNRIEPTVNTG